MTRVIFAVAVFAALGFAGQITAYQNAGDCYELVTDYLQRRNVAFIVSPELRGTACNWNFKGKTEADFSAWCRASGYTCGGNPFFVGRDSVYDEYGNWTSRRKASAAVRARNVADSLSRLADSVAAVRATPLPRKRVFVEYLELSKGTAEKLGFRYSDYIGTAKFFEYTDLFSVTIQAQESGDTSYVYRNYRALYDSTLSLFWGGHRQRQTSSSVTSSGIVSTNYEDESYGLTIKLDGLKYTYDHSADYEHSIRGNGLLKLGENKIFGTYKSFTREEVSLPWFGQIPLLGALFRHEQERSEWRYIFIRVLLEDEI